MTGGHCADYGRIADGPVAVRTGRARADRGGRPRGEADGDRWDLDARQPGRPGLGPRELTAAGRGGAQGRRPGRRARACAPGHHERDRGRRRHDRARRLRRRRDLQQMIEAAVDAGADRHRAEPHRRRHRHPRRHRREESEGPRDLPGEHGRGRSRAGVRIAAGHGRGHRASTRSVACSTSWSCTSTRGMSATEALRAATVTAGPGRVGDERRRDRCRGYRADLLVARARIRGPDLEVLRRPVRRRRRRPCRSTSAGSSARSTEYASVLA